MLKFRTAKLVDCLVAAVTNKANNHGVLLIMVFGKFISIFFFFSLPLKVSWGFQTLENNEKCLRKVLPALATLASLEELLYAHVDTYLRPRLAKGALISTVSKMFCPNYHCYHYSVCKRIQWVHSVHRKDCVNRGRCGVKVLNQARWALHQKWVCWHQAP